MFLGERITAPQPAPNTGSRKVTVTALDGPTRAIRRKYIRQVTPVHSSASTSTQPHAAAEGGCAGHAAAAGSASSKAPPARLPVADTTGGTSPSRFFA